MGTMRVPSLVLALSRTVKGTIANGSLLLVIGIVVILSLSVFTMLPQSSVVLLPQQQQQAGALNMTGQQYFANGTGIAYFDDNSTSKFEHEMRQLNGWYYDNKTIFYVGEIPGVSTANNVKCSGGGHIDTSNNSTTTIVSNSSNSSNNTTNHTLTIINGANVIENKSEAIQPSAVITIKAGDTVTWTNEDSTTHSVTAPPGHFQFEGKIMYGQTFDALLSGTHSGIAEDRSFSCTFTEPGGFQYDVDNANNRIVGAVIVE